MESKYIPYSKVVKFNTEEALNKAKNLRSFMERRRSMRSFSERDVPKVLIESLLMTGSSAPSGANKQPWMFCAVSNKDLKKKIRLAAEEEEKVNYSGRMGEEWLEDLKKFETNWEKPFLETAPWLIVVFRRNFDLIDGEKQKNYYVGESVGLATGFLLAAIHQAGLVSLTHTPSPLNFLTKLLKRPSNERPFLLIPVGFPPEKPFVPDISKKKAHYVITYYE